MATSKTVQRYSSKESITLLYIRQVPYQYIHEGRKQHGECCTCMLNVTKALHCFEFTHTYVPRRASFFNQVFCPSSCAETTFPSGNEQLVSLLTCDVEDFLVVVTCGQISSKKSTRASDKSSILASLSNYKFDCNWLTLCY